MVLRKNTIQTASTIADLNYQQVLDNVARFETTPSSLPSLAIVNAGTVTVTDQSTFGGAGTYSPTISSADQIGGFPIFSLFLNPNLSRGLTENWNLVPVTDIAKVRRLRCAFQMLVCDGDPSTCEDCIEQLEDYLPDDPASLACAIPTNWYCVGCKADVPKDACFVGCHQNKYAWVLPQDMEGLSRFTLTVMQLATTEVTTETKTVLKKYDADDKLQGTEITTTESDDETKRTVLSEIQTDDTSKVTLPRSAFPRSHRSSPLSPKQIRKRPGLSNLLSPRPGGP
jgi:hypothetical protein